MVLDAGDIKYQPGHTVTLDAAGNTVEGGDAVTFDGSGNITRATDTDLLIGTTMETKKDGDHDNRWAVSVAGLGVVVEMAADEDPSLGAQIEPATAGDGTYQVDADAAVEGSQPFILEAEDATDSDGNPDLYVAIFR